MDQIQKSRTCSLTIIVYFFCYTTEKHSASCTLDRCINGGQRVSLGNGSSWWRTMWGSSGSWQSCLQDSFLLWRRVTSIKHERLAHYDIKQSHRNYPWNKMAVSGACIKHMGLDSSPWHLPSLKSDFCSIIRVKVLIQFSNKQKGETWWGWKTVVCRSAAASQAFVSEIAYYSDRSSGCYSEGLEDVQRLQVSGGHDESRGVCLCLAMLSGRCRVCSAGVSMKASHVDEWVCECVWIIVCCWLCCFLSLNRWSYGPRTHWSQSNTHMG